MQYVMFVLGIVIAGLIVIVPKKMKFIDKSNKFIMAIVKSILIALALEICTFNFTSYQQNNNRQLEVHYDFKEETNQVVSDNLKDLENNTSDKSNIKSTKDGENCTYSVELAPNEKIEDIDISFAGNAQSAQCLLYYKDSASTQNYAKADNEFAIVRGVEKTGHVKPHFAGTTKQLKIELKTTDGEEISNLCVITNKKVKFDFNVVRAILTALLVFLGFLFAYTKKEKFNMKVFVFVMTLQILFVVALSIGSNLYFFEDGSLDTLSYVTPVDPYQELTVALSQGRFDTNGTNPQYVNEEENIQKLKGLDNVYEPAQRTGISYRWDRAFFNGKYYCYFGIVPVLCMYLPVYLLTGKLINTKILALLLVIATMIMMVKLVITIAKKWKKKFNMWIMIAIIIGFINSSFLIFCINGSRFYEVASVSALLCAIVGMDFLFNTFKEDGIYKKNLILGALFMALSVGCRPNYILASLMVAPLILNGLAKKGGYKKAENTRKNLVGYVKGVFSQKNIKEIIYLVLPYIIIGLGLMYYNYARFGSVAEFGAKYQLTVYDTSYYHMSDLGKLPIALARGLFMIPNMSATFPYLSAHIDSTNYVGYFYSMAYMGIFAYPIMWLLCLVPWSLKRGVKKHGYRGVMVMSGVVALIMCYITTAMGGTSLRYFADFGWMFYIPVIFVIFSLCEQGEKKKISKYIVGFVMALAVATLVVTMLVAISPSWSSLKTHQAPLYCQLEKMIVFWK